MKHLMLATLVALSCSVAQAQIVVDGELDATGYTRVATQTVNTQFGDAVAPDFFGSELDAMYTAFENSRMFVFLAGNLENNFNKLEVFFDTVPGGENSLSSIPQYDFLIGDGPDWESQLLGGFVSGGPGMTFDAGFEVDYHMFFRKGFVSENVFDADFIDRMGGIQAMVPGNGARASFDFETQTGSGSIDPGSLALNASGNAINRSIPYAINNSNELGVSGDLMAAVDPAVPEAVTTGIEFSIDITELGLTPLEAATIRIFAVQNGGAHDFVSNQTLPGLPAFQGNLGGNNLGDFVGDSGFVDFSVLAGDQFVSVEFTPDGGLLGDVNCDGSVDLLDVGPFVDLISAGEFSSKADFDGNGAVDLLDVGPFVDTLSGN